jgi:CHAT domain-containing protein/tetratricopeptide (TPR) repeat protein
MKNRGLSKNEILLKYSDLQRRSFELLYQSENLKNQGDLDASVPSYEELIAVLRQRLDLTLLNNRRYPDSPLDVPSIVDPMVTAMLVQADVFEAAGNLERAEERREQALSLSRKHLTPFATAERERQRAGSLVGQGRFNEALILLASARDRFSEEGDPARIASVTTTIAGIYEWLSDFERALAEAKRASRVVESYISKEEISQQGIISSLDADRLQEAEIRMNLLQTSQELDQIQARANRSLGNLSEAERQFRRILPNMPEAAQAAIQFQLASIRVAQGHFEEGLKHIERLEPAFRGLLRPKLAVLLRYKAEALLGLGKRDEALALIDAAIEDLSRYRDYDSLWKIQRLRARTLEALDRPVEALEAYAQTTDTINKLRKAPLGYRLDSTYLRDKLPTFEAAITLACEQGEAEVCCQFMEMIKSRILTAALSVPAHGVAEGTGDLDGRVDGLSYQIDALEYAGYRDGWTEEAEQRMSSLLQERTALMERIRFSDPRWRSLSEPVPFSVEDTLDIVTRHDQAALSLFYQPPRVTSVLLKDGRCSVAAVEMSDETSADLVTYQRNLQSTRSRSERYDPSISLGLNAEDLVAPELLVSALQARSLVVIPHGPLHLLPWAGLTFGGKRLFEYCPVGILPNLSCIPLLQADFSSSPGVALVGAPDYAALPGLRHLNFAQAELETIEEIYSSHGEVIGDVLMDRAATESNFWRLCEQRDAAGNILHVACHGNFTTGDPMNAGLLLTDGKIDATEIARSRLLFNEVILSACSTGYRPTEVGTVMLSGDDILGLPGAFLEAGARSVLVSIPRARDDATLEFMTIYHEKRTEAHPPLVALQETQKTMLSCSVHPPNLWIGFTAYGCQ